MALPLPVGYEDAAPSRFRGVLALDHSGSMYPPFGSDVDGDRAIVGLSLVEFLRRWGGGRVAVVPWGSDAPERAALPLTDVRRGRRELRHALAIPPSMGGTNIPAALDRCRMLLSRIDDEDVPAVFLVTDAQPAVGGRSVREMFADIRGAVAALPPDAVHVQVIDGRGAVGAELEEAWRDLPLGSFVRLDIADAREMAWQVAQQVAAAFGLRMPERELPRSAEERRPA